MKKVFVIIIFSFCSMMVSAQEATPATESDTSWMHDPGFAYIPTLDSMLRVTNNRIDSLNASVRINTSKGSGPSAFAAFFQNTAVRIFFWALLAVFVAYIVYSIFFRYPAVKSLKDDNGEEVIEVGKLLDADSCHQKIAAAEREGNYRLAVRYLFMQILAQLDSNGKIHFAPEKTNADYIREMRGDDFLDHFARLSGVFIYTWYGHQFPREDDYWEIKQLFIDYNKLS